jgi:hypothetical protein
MVTVRLILTGRTNIYASEDVLEFLAEFNEVGGGADGETINLVIGKLQKWAMMGLRHCPELVNEGEHVYRLRVANSGRLIGFFALEDFILIAFYKKKGQKPNRIQKGIIERVKKIRNKELWEVSNE